ncbi:MAG: MFS transporter, partial [Rubrivivax sp.]
MAVTTELDSPGTLIRMAVVALILCALALAGGLNAPLLLALTFLNGIGMALRWPVFSASVPELV